MNQREARDNMGSAMEANIQAWASKAINRAAEKIRIYTEKGKSTCELDLKYPPRNPDDDTSAEVAELLVKHFEAKRYCVQMIQKVNHLGAICIVKWSGSKRLDA